MSPIKYTCFVDLESYCLKRGMDFEQLKFMIANGLIPNNLFRTTWMVDEKGLEKWGEMNPLYWTARAVEKPPGGRG